MSFQIKGVVEVRVIDSRNGEVKQIIKQNNLIPNNTFKLVLGEESTTLVPRPTSGGTQAAIAIYSNVNLYPGTFELGPPISMGFVPEGITTPIWYEDASPPYGELYNRIDYTGFDRSFRGIALIRKDGRQQVNAKAIAYLLLATTCVQGAYDFLDIYYRIQFPNAIGITKTGLLDFGANFFDTKEWLFFYLSTYFGKKPVSGYTNLWVNSENIVISTTPNRSSTNSERRWDTITINSTSYNTKFVKNWKEDAHIGRIFNLLMHGKSNSLAGHPNLQSAYTHSDEITDVVGDAPYVFQAMFGHRAGATVPFFDSLALPLGNGKVRLSGTWTGKLPELYRIEIVQGGDVGVATYKWSVRKHLGFVGNTYTDRTIECVYRNPKIAAAPKMHGWRETDNDVHRWSNTQIVQYDETGVTLLDIFDGAYTNWEASTEPFLPVTQVRQCAVDAINQKIYVGCRITGLWIIDVATNTITHPITQPCYGVDVGRNSVAYALCEGGLYSSANWANALAFTYTGITDNNWSKVYYLKVDPEHIENRLALIIAVSNANNRIVWLRLNPQPVTLTYSSNGDTNGVCYYRGTYNQQDTWTNPHTATVVTVIPSSAVAGSAGTIVNRSNDTFNTSNVASSYIAIDLGEDITLIPNRCTLQNHATASSAIRNFKIQGSNNVSANTVAGVNTATWTDLDTRVNDTSMANTASSWGNYTITPPTISYRWLRILQTGVNASNTNILAVSEIEFYGTANFQKVASGLQDVNIKPWVGAVDVSDSGGFWATTYSSNAGLSARKLHFGLPKNKDGSNTNTLSFLNITHPVWGSVSLFKISFYQNYLITSTALFDFFLSVINTYTSISGRTFVIHLDSGITLSSQRLRQLFTDNLYPWNSYGWNSTSWELNHAGAKPSHLENQSLGNGVSIRFESSNNTPIFSASDFYTQSVNYGFLKDNASYLNWNSTQFTRPTHFRDKFETLIPQNADTLEYFALPNTVVPGDEIDFPVLVDDETLYNIFIDGKPATRIYTFKGPFLVRIFDQSSNKFVDVINPSAPKPRNYRECTIFSSGYVLLGPGCFDVPIIVYYTWIEL